MERCASGEPRFRHADGTSYGMPVAAPSSAVQTRAFQALRGLGFREGAAREALCGAATHVGSGIELEPLLRHALLLLPEKAVARAA